MAGQFFFAAQYLTRMPATAQEARPLPDGISVWFPAVGLVFGAGLGIVLRIASVIDIWFAALAGVIAWTLVTRARPLAGLAAFAADDASARQPGVSGADASLPPRPSPIGAPVATIAVTLMMLTQLVLLMLLTVRMDYAEWITLALLLGWARFAPLVWVNTAARMRAQTHENDAAVLWPADRAMTARWAVALFIASLLVDYALLAAPLALMAWQAWMRRTNSLTVTGVLAGIALVEGVTLAAVIVRGMLAPLGME